MIFWERGKGGQKSNSLILIWSFFYAKASKHLIVPLLAMVGELTRRQKELIKIIQAKDKEIDDYKSQGAKASRSKFLGSK